MRVVVLRYREAARKWAGRRRARGDAGRGGARARYKASKLEDEVALTIEDLTDEARALHEGSVCDQVADAEHGRDQLRERAHVNAAQRWVVARGERQERRAVEVVLVVVVVFDQAKAKFR